MDCPKLEYRDADFADEPRAYCLVQEAFVEPMRADVCHDRYDLDHATDCEFFREDA